MDNSNIENNLNNIFNSDQIPDNIKEMLNNIANSNKSNDNNQGKHYEPQESNHNNSSINPEIINNIINMLNQNYQNNTNNSDSSSNTSIDMDMLLKMKTIIDKMNSNKDDPRANLLLSLKPYLKESRKAKVDQYAKLFSMSKVIEIFNNNGGDNRK